MAVDASAGHPLAAHQRQANDAANALPPITGLRAAQLIADRAYDAHALLDHAEAIGARPIIPQRSRMNRPRDFDPAISNQSKRIERTIATRYDHLAAN